MAVKRFSYHGTIDTRTFPDRYKKRQALHIFEHHVYNYSAVIPYNNYLHYRYTFLKPK